MKIQFFNGGLANQAFQYVFARYYELSHPGEIMYLDDSYFALNTVHNGYELEKVFGIRPHMLSECFDAEVWEYILEERRQGKSVPQILCENGIEMRMISEIKNGFQKFNPFDGKITFAPLNEYCPEILEEEGDIYYHGYWIHKKWFETYRTEFLKEFEFPEITDSKNQKYLDHIQNVNSVSIHVRRGDYVTLGWALDVRWFRMCMERFKAAVPGKWELFVFSDDIPWCKEHQRELGFDMLNGITFVEGNMNGKNYIDMQLMSKCKAMIMSNSAFCYLAELLNVDMKYFINVRNY